MMHIMNDISRMSRLKGRAGLHITTASNATAEYIAMVRVLKKVRKIWSRIKPEFELKYSKMKGYNYYYIESFTETLLTILTVRLNRLDKDISNRGDVAVEDYLLKQMKMNKNELIER